MNSITVIVLLASLAVCAADVSHLIPSRNYLPPLSGAVGYSYSSYPSYTGNAYSSGGYYSGSSLGSGYGYGAPLVTSGYNNYNSYPTVPQYNNYATPSRAYLPAVTNYGGLDTKYAANGGYVY